MHSLKRRFASHQRDVVYHWCEVRMKMYVMNITRSKESAPIPRLNEEAAIELGANLLGEGVIFGIAVAILAFEVGRQKEKDRKKEEKEADFINGLENRINELTFANEELDTKIRELTRAVYATQHQMQVKGRPPEEQSLKFDSRKAENTSHESVIIRAVMDARSKIRS
ncbi:optic atrophy 3 protein homolog isoform X5 [Macrobrachium rosenbergii]|uniref:optic atrophy 3 protein homolog isoform X5 n=1 Tax=Macrobrachium rosenbergii TaxID=79674 RepID=UPI0034D6A162